MIFFSCILSIFSPVDVVADQRGVEQNAEPLPSNQEQDVEENVKDVPDFISIIWLVLLSIGVLGLEKHSLRQNKRIEGCALVYGVLVIRFQLVESNDL